jgi:hypothetical protein
MTDACLTGKIIAYQASNVKPQGIGLNDNELPRDQVDWLNAQIAQQQTSIPVIARKAKLNPASVWKVLNRKVRAKPKTLQRLAKALGKQLPVMRLPDVAALPDRQAIAPATLPHNDRNQSLSVVPHPRETLSTGDSGDLPHASEEAENLSPGAARSSMKGASTALRKPPSVEMIADRAAELVGQLAQRLYDKDPRLLREWLIRLAVDTPPELVPEVDALISLAREARWRWKADDAEEVGNTGSAKDDSTE